MTSFPEPVLGPLLDDAFYRELIDDLNDGVYFVDLNKRITYLNRSAERITGYAKSEVLGHHCHDDLLRHVDGEGKHLCGDGYPLAATYLDGKGREVRVFLQHKGGHRVPVLVRSAPIRDDRGRVVEAVEVFTDESSRVESIRRVEELEQIALLDALTGVGNHRFCEHVLEQRLAELHRHGWPFGILFLDVDHFKEVNDLHGHAAGDAVLKTVSRSLMHGVRGPDFVGRWGGGGVRRSRGSAGPAGAEERRGEAPDGRRGLGVARAYRDRQGHCVDRRDDGPAGGRRRLSPRKDRFPVVPEQGIGPEPGGHGRLDAG